MVIHMIRLENEGAVGLAKDMLDSIYNTTSRRESLPITFVDRFSFEVVMDRIVTANDKRARDSDDPGGGS